MAVHRRNRAGVFLVFWAAAVPLNLAGAEPARPKPTIDFDRQIRPILSDACYKCHGPDGNERQAELRLDRREAAIEPAESGRPAIVPGRPEQSTLVKRIFSKNSSVVMPPPSSNRSLTDTQRNLLREWIAEGADYQSHWSFIPPVQTAPPPVKLLSWPRNPIDHFILARLESEGLQPAPEADKAVLIRRVTLDLTGLPPTLAEVDAFLRDDRSDAYDRVVDRLLSSNRYGERMALDWLDASRFADTNGYHLDNGRDMTHWRDWVIEAFNRNLPFDRFTIEQLAGDLLPSPTLSQQIASGFNRNHMINFEGGAIPEEYQTAYVLDRVNTTGTVWLGLTIACAQCHDHKFDPVSQKEYYQLYAFFNNLPENGLDGRKGNAEPMIPVPSPEQAAESARLTRALRDQTRLASQASLELDAGQADWERKALRVGPDASPRLPKRIAQILGVPIVARTESERDELRGYYRDEVSAAKQRTAQLKAELAALEKTFPSTMVMREMAKPRDTFLLERGQYDQHGERVAPGTPAALPPLPPDAPRNRLTLARWLVDPAHPLMARVTVNRFWQSFFGTGLVETAEDFGSQGAQPSHPELLDWLAVEFRNGWDVKALIRTLVTSAAYRQSAVASAGVQAKDPANRLLARGPRHRLQAEFIRDQALAISGLLDDRIGGKSVSPYQPAGLWEELASRLDGKNWTAQTYEQSRGRDLYRRTMYTFWKRTSPPPTLVAFDAPDRETCTVRRSRTNTPLQALVLMNDPTYVEASRKLAERMMREPGPTPDDRIRFAFRLATARPPSAAETQVLRDLFRAQLDDFRNDPAAAAKLLGVGESDRDQALDVPELAAWSIVASAILNLDETVTKG